MKKELLLTIFIVLFSISGMYGQNNPYYYYKGEKVYLTVDKSTVNISTEENVQKSSITALDVKDFDLATDKNAKGQKSARLEFKNVPTDEEFQKKIKSLKENPAVKNVSLYYKRENAKPIGTSAFFYVKLKKENDLARLQKVASKKEVEIVKQVPNMPQWYILSAKKNNAESSVDLANYFFETGFFEDVDPAFMFDFKSSCTNDTNFGSLWGLYNAANTNIDINACQAWTISQGSGIKIAVVDQGIDMAHNDLAANFSSLSYDALSGTSPSVFTNGNWHGTHVAGTIGAIKDNNLQVVGVAPLSKIMAVSHPLLVTPTMSAEVASGISWAYQNNADVINNSWGDHGGAYYSSIHTAILEDAIIKAMTLGRGGKGCVVVFASGNYGDQGAVMDYPAYFNDNILTVGSIDSGGTRAFDSGYGIKLDVVAPGVGIKSTAPGNTLLDANGTSMASPHVAGISALILSANPSLTGQQVRDIIEQTSQKVGSYSYGLVTDKTNGTWNTQTGYGLVDAYAAVLAAQCTGTTSQISGAASICSSASYSAPTGGTTYNWSVTQSSSLVTLSGNGTSSVTLTKTSQTGTGQITLSLYYGSASCGYRTINKTITIGSNFVATLHDGVGPYGQVDVFVQGGAPPYNVYRGETTLIYTSNSPGTFVVPFGCGGGILKVEANTSCGLVAYRKMYSGCNTKSSVSTQASSKVGDSSFYKIYPNPASSIINISLINEDRAPDFSAQINAILYDLNGQEKSNVAVVNNTATINVSQLQKGVYVLIVNINGVSESHQVLVE
ncbi:putative secreted protein (Por secretion system target) [Flavobacterium sp. 9]|uniref:S8 family serine peptidase n=1 Tax=Flavobacterium sp. 9 TaxID=2035198 RepID=UPI000C185A8C|nr:S8 family serine peptidase [Flavobacterium sp. 9]PIF30396.1 putative secreted protein (Por secretion system target) [Flavobacterium sp. 9]